VIVTVPDKHPTVQEAITLVARQVKPLIVVAPGIEPGPHIPAGTLDLL